MDRKRVAYISAAVIVVALVLVFRSWGGLEASPADIKMAPGEHARTEDEPEH